LSELPERRTSSAAVTLDDKVYVIVGFYNKDDDTMMTNQQFMSNIMQNQDFMQQLNQ